jgi:hypothetical protein
MLHHHSDVAEHRPEALLDSLRKNQVDQSWEYTFSIAIDSSFKIIACQNENLIRPLVNSH